MYRLRLSNSAQKDMDRLRGALFERVRDALLALRQDPRPHGSVKLRGGGDSYRVRVGSYRVIYELDDGEQLITVLRVRPRGDVYRRR